MLIDICASSGCSTRWRAAVLTWRATQSRKRRQPHWSSKRERRQQQWRQRRRQQQPTARPGRKRAARVGAAAVEAAVWAQMKMEKYSSRPEMEGVARLDPASLLVVSLFFACTFLPWTIRSLFQCCRFLKTHVPLHLASTDQAGVVDGKICFNLDFFFF